MHRMKRNPKKAPNAIRDYILNIFSCRSCSEHFKNEIEQFRISEIKTTKDGILWLWKLHNSVNLRLKGDKSEDPQVPKFNYPTSWICKDCTKFDPRVKKPIFVEENVFNFLLNKYSMKE